MRKNVSKTAIIVTGNTIVVLICLIFLTFGLWKVLSDQVFDINMKQSMTGAPHGDILVIGIDAESIKAVGPYPWDRKVYAQLINQLEKAGARVIGFDIELYTESNNPESDKLLGEEIAKYKNIIFPSHAELENEFARSTKVKEGELIMAQRVQNPIPAINKSMNKAHINAAFDTDGVIRFNWLQINTPEGILPSMGLAMAQLAGADVSKYVNMPVQQNSPKSQLTIKWDGVEKDFETIPFSEVYKGKIPAGTFKDRIILVGYTAPGSDEGITPVERHMHLVYAHANILNQILNQKIITPVSGSWTVALAALMILLFGFLTWRLKAISGIILVFSVSIGLMIVQYLTFAYSDFYLDSVGAVLSGLVSYLGNIAMKTYFETKQKNYITKQFGRYISPDLVKEIASSDSEIQLGGIKRELTLLFLDVSGFTPLSEKLKPEEVVDFLNMMFNLITERALENHGTIDKFIGDAAMILYNAPLDVPNHAFYAVKTGHEIQKGMEQVRADVEAKYGINLSIRIGINTGDVVVGNIGSYLRVDYTAIGDNVNTAARIESTASPNQVWVSESTYEQTKDYIEYNFAGEKLMKGKSSALKLFEVVSIKGTPAEGGKAGKAS
ncbi:MULTISPECIES: CHASE2 domain-containing protein [Paenibacillus]|uniref:Adenylate/guanylate cyclase domain-containing protein n=1 Tax=Paenibacillus radicis (ex Xue et al. 2023) TaxID=2972489 RepID=A0ABT1YD62_9BACL|nr:adenylate/guanylate cyclase domain-containing protein [Paenibacillus radicis (ex Xue et al. 2023)]MCR8631121.1 adenylate/guanylate cyclase domain-containing protein [Paenibacillus radicis (ex Xue et al. 2023)]